MGKGDKKSAADDELKPGGKARAQKAAAVASKESSARAQQEAQEAEAWNDGANTRKMQKQQEADRAAAEKAAKKAQVAAQLAAEEEEIKNGRKLRGTEKVAARKAQEVSDDHSSRIRLNETGMEARTIEDAIAVLNLASGDSTTTASLSALASISSSGGAGGGGAAAAAAAAAAADDAHPEKRMKAAFTRFRETKLAELKAEFPTLRMSQHLEMLKRLWDKSPENPIVAAEKAKLASSSSWKGAGGGGQ